MKKTQINPKFLAIGLVVGVIALAGVGFMVFKKGSPTEETGQTQEPAKRKIAEPVNVISVSERPYIKIIPQADGRNLELVVDSVKNAATSMEYELEYQAGTLLQGAFGLVELTNTPASAKILLGSCSAGGACTYHTDVKGGSLVARFEGTENYALKQEWRYFDNAAGDTEVASKDAKFQLESPDLGSARFIIVYNSPGYAGSVDGTVVSEIYTLTSNNSLNGEGELTIRASEEEDLTIYGYDGTSWQSFETTSDGKEATATVDLMEAYLVAKK